MDANIRNIRIFIFAYFLPQYLISRIFLTLGSPKQPKTRLFHSQRPKIRAESRFLSISYPQKLPWVHQNTQKKISWEKGTWECNETLQGVYKSILLAQHHNFDLKMLPEQCSIRLKTIFDVLGPTNWSLIPLKATFLTFGGSKTPKTQLFSHEPAKTKRGIVFFAYLIPLGIISGVS